MLDKKEIFEAMKAMGLNTENMEQIKEMALNLGSMEQFKDMGLNVGNMEQIKEMDINAGDMGQFEEMLKGDPKNERKLPKIKVTFECGADCDYVVGEFLYIGPLPECASRSKEVIILLVCGRTCIINLDKVVCVKILWP